jgi:hypothetical protein
MKMKQLLTLLLCLSPLLVFSACSDNGSSNTSDESNGDPASEESIDNNTISTEEPILDDPSSDPNISNPVPGQTEENPINAQPGVESCASLGQISQAEQLACELNFANQVSQ